MIKFIESIFLTETGYLNFFGKLVVSIIIYLFAKMFFSAIDKILNMSINKRFKNLKDPQRNETILKLIRNLAKYIIYFIAIIIILDLFGINTTSIIATAGVGGIAIAFGAQSLVKDVIGGMIIFLEDSFSIGDLVDLDGISGTVIELGMRKTILQDYDKSYILIPNGDISKIRNYSRDNMRADISIPVSYKTPFSDMKKIISEISEELKDDKGIIEGPSLLGIDEFNDFSYVIKVTSIVKQGQKSLYMRKYREMVIDKFNKYNIKFPTEYIIKDGDIDEKI